MRTERILKSILFSLVVSCAVSAQAGNTYYVAPTGSDLNPGSEVLPWQHIDYGVDQLGPGDKLYVRGGVYYEAVTIYDKTTTTSTSRIEIAEYPGEVAIIDGTGLPADTAVVTIGGGTKFVTFKRFTVRNGPASGIYVRKATDLEILENHVHGNAEFGINIRTPSTEQWGATNTILVKGNYVYDNCRRNASRDQSSWKQGISVFRANNVTITGNDVYQNWGEGIDYILSDNGTITNNEVFDNFSVNIYLDNAQSTKVDSNFIKCASSAYYRDGHPATGVLVANETYTEFAQNVADSLTISNNIVLRCEHGLGYWAGEYNNGMHNSLIAHNVFYNTTKALIDIEGNVHTNNVVANNILYQKYSKAYVRSDATSGFTYYYNVWYGGGDDNTRVHNTGDITQDPLLQSVGGSAETDYKLQPGSPCINTGTSTAVTTDYWGTTRSAPDIGIHEYTTP